MPEPDAFVIEAQPEFRWTGRSEPVSYRFQLSATADFRAPMVDEASRRAAFHAPAPLPPGRYYWRVATNSEREGQGPFSDPQRFRRPADGPAAEPPAIDDEVLKLRWRAGADGVRYQLQISADPEFGEIALDVETNEAELALPIPPRAPIMCVFAASSPAARPVRGAPLSSSRCRMITGRRC